MVDSPCFLQKLISWYTVMIGALHFIELLLLLLLLLFIFDNCVELKKKEAKGTHPHLFSQGAAPTPVAAAEPTLAERRKQIMATELTSFRKPMSILGSMRLVCSLSSYACYNTLSYIRPLARTWLATLESCTTFCAVGCLVEVHGKKTATLCLLLQFFKYPPPPSS